MSDAVPSPLAFRDPARAHRLLDALAQPCADREADPLALMHVCGSHEQAIARFGLRDALPKGLDLFMGPGCPVCVTDAPEIDARRIGRCTAARVGSLVLDTGFGRRLVTESEGELLPRIC